MLIEPIQKSQISKRFVEVRSYSVSLCKPLQTEDYIPQPVAFASPPKWHLAHTTWFFEEMILKKFSTDYQEFHSHFSFLFNSYYQTVGERAIRAERGSITRPSIEEVYAYRSYVDKHIVELIENRPSNELEELIILGINHEQQHQELLLTDLKHTLHFNPIWPVYEQEYDLTDDQNRSFSWISIPEGVYEIGHQGDGFCFDNELGRHRAFLESFEVCEALVTNGEYQEFIEDGGYKNFKYWLDEGWSWIVSEDIHHPLYWKKIDGQWHQYTLAGLKRLSPDSILAHISFYEAQAYATWKKMRLLTEFEWEVASDQLAWGKRWEWTYSAYLPYPNFKIADGAVGEYNGKFMINTMVLRGASNATSSGHSRKTYRNFFHPQYRWQYTGIRLAK